MELHNFVRVRDYCQVCNDPIPRSCITFNGVLICEGCIELAAQLLGLIEAVEVEPVAASQTN